jgi:hypothetical protein
MSVAIGDINGDGRRDLVVPTTEGLPTKRVSVLVNTPRLCNVQDVSGMTQAAARRTLAGAGCKVGRPRQVRSTGVERGRVLSQKPGFGALPHDRTVHLVVSAGPGPPRTLAPPSFAPPVSYPVEHGGQAVAIADLDGDGSQDVVTANCGRTASVLLNRGDGTFRPRRDYHTDACPEAMAVGDVSGDRRPDIVTSNEETISVLLNRGDGTFEARHDYSAPGEQAYGENYVALGDLDGDGKPEVVVANALEDANSGLWVFFNKGDGTFEPKHHRRLGGDLPSAVAIGDLNGDGKPDLATENGWQADVILNRGSGKLQQAKRTYRAGGDGSDVFLGDLNDDRRADMVVTYPDGNAVQVFLNNGDGSFRPYVDYRAGGLPSWVAIGDLNGDGTPDMTAANSSAHSVSVMLNRGDGTFKAKLDYAVGRRSPAAVAAGDLNGDGRADLVTVNGNDVSALINTPGR